MPGESTMRYPDHIEQLFDELTDLTAFQRTTLKERFRHLMAEYRYRCRLYSGLFYILRLTMTVGSLAVPALLSTTTFSGAAATELFWVTWCLSLAVTTANAILTLFKLDKRFFMIHSTAERLRSETWQFLQLAGRYSGHFGTNHGSSPVTHASQFVYYCSQFEKINMKRVEDEFIKGGDDKHPPPSAAAPVHPQNGKRPRDDLLVPSPPYMDTPEPLVNNTQTTHKAIHINLNKENVIEDLQDVVVTPFANANTPFATANTQQAIALQMP
jgi:hypothetical protein